MLMEGVMLSASTNRYYIVHKQTGLVETMIALDPKDAFDPGDEYELKHESLIPNPKYAWAEISQEIIKESE